MELERLSYIGPEEFVQAFAKENPHLETSFKDMKKTRNLESYVQWFNRLSYFVATEVCKVNDSFVVHWIVQHCGVYETLLNVPQFMGHVKENYMDKSVNAVNTVGRYDTRHTPYLHDHSASL